MNIFNPFLFYSNKLQALLVKAESQKNPALWLYQNDARTPLFMLEALTRLHNKGFDEPLFKKWNKRFKTIEDALGQIDYYAAFEKDNAKNKKITATLKSYLNAVVLNNTESLNQYLINNKWFNGKVLNFNVKISKFDYLCNEEYTTELKIVLKKELSKCVKFCEKYNYEFTELENQVHELRRKMRWISIYAQALNGIIQLKKTNTKPKYSINYFIPEILKSSFNKLPTKPKECSIIEFDSNSFYALSYVIYELGKLKDQGLNIKILMEAILKTEKISKTKAHQKALLVLGIKNNTEMEILNVASKLAFTALSKDKILNTLLCN